MHLSLLGQFPLLCLFGFLFLQVSSVSNSHPDTRRQRWPLTQAHLFSCAVEEGHYKQIPLACVGSAHSVWTTLGLLQLTAACAFLVYTAQAPGCSAGELSKVGPGLRAFPRSERLRFRFLGILQRHRLSSACVFLPFSAPSSSGNQVLGELTVSDVQCIVSPFHSQSLSFLGVPQEPSKVCRVSPLGS